MMFSCGGYKQNLLFRPDENFDNSAFGKVTEALEKDQIIAKSDYLAIEIYTNCGERIIDPNYEIDDNKDREQRAGAGGGGGGRNAMINPNDLSSYIDPTGISRYASQRKYLVDERGNVNLPKVGEVTIVGMTLSEAQKYLEQLYSAYYVDPFIFLRYTNKRIIVLGALGNRILPLENENITIVEAIALIGNMDENTRANKIRLIRNIKSGKPIMKEIDLTTFNGLLAAELKIMPNDILYIEPRRRPFKEFIADLGAVTSIFSTSLTLILTTLFLLDRFDR
jgi:polysaccharide export outer membrane protein